MSQLHNRHTDAKPVVKPLVFIGAGVVIVVLIVMWFFISTVDNSSIDTTEHSIDSSLTNYGVRLADTVNRPQLIADCTAGHDITVDVVTLATPETAQVATIECKAKNGTYEPIVIGLMPDEGANPSVP